MGSHNLTTRTVLFNLWPPHKPKELIYSSHSLRGLPTLRIAGRVASPQDNVPSIFRGCGRSTLEVTGMAILSQPSQSDHCGRLAEVCAERARRRPRQIELGLEFCGLARSDITRSAAPNHSVEHLSDP